MNRRLKFLLILIFPFHLLAEINSTDIDLKNETTEVKNLLQLTGGYVNLTRDSVTVSAMEVNVGLLRALNHQWALGVELTEASSLSNTSSVYSRLGLGISYALKGYLPLKKETYKINNKDIVKAQMPGQSQWNLNFLVRQYFFSGSQTIVPLSGLGLSTTYQFPTQNFLAYKIGLGVDYATNENLSITPFYIFFGIQGWLGD
ncbi:MAG: hypothetical protein KDD58_03480 [Bdellovibrionales bacterium]|nr:hypothetical protein [Bdellovibrionales bacterium]